jgi:hypothetical protein
MTVPIASPGTITPNPTPPTVLPSFAAPPAVPSTRSTVTVPTVPSDSVHSAAASVLHSSVHPSTTEDDSNESPFLPSLSARAQKRLERLARRTHTGTVSPPRSPTRGFPASSSFPVHSNPLEPIVLDEDDDIDPDNDASLDPSDNPMDPAFTSDTELSAPDNDMDSPPSVARTPVTPSPAPRNINNVLMSTQQKGTKRSSTSTTPTSSSSPSSSSSSPPTSPPSSTSSSSPSSPPDPATTPTSSTPSPPPKRKKATPSPPAESSINREAWTKNSSTPTDDPSTSTSTPPTKARGDKRSAKEKDAAEGGGKQTNAALMKSNAELRQQVADLLATVKALTSQRTTEAQSTPPPQPIRSYAAANGEPYSIPPPPATHPAAHSSAPLQDPSMRPPPSLHDPSMQPPCPLRAHPAAPPQAPHTAASSAAPSISTRAAARQAPAPASSPPPAVDHSQAPTGSAAPANPAPPTQPRAGPARRPPLPTDQRARPPQALIRSMGLDPTSNKDLTLAVSFPPNIRGRFTMDRPPRHSNNDSKLRHSIASLLLKGLGIPAPRLLKAVSQHDSADTLYATLYRAWSPSIPAPGPTPDVDMPPSPANSNDPPPATRISFLDELAPFASSEDTGDSGLGSRLLRTPPTEPDCSCHREWHEYLNPSTDSLSSATTATGTKHVLRLAFNNKLVALAVRAHIEQYTALLLPTGSYTPSALAAMTKIQQSWVTSATKANALHTQVRLDSYGIRYETTLVNGWTRGPDHQLLPSESANFDELYGDTNRFKAFIHRIAPNCHPAPTTFLADGTGSIQFVHEAQHRNELYRLIGLTSPSEGVTRPLRLSFKQLKRPEAQCCSVCGVPGHLGHQCPLRNPQPPPNSDAMEEEEKKAPPSKPLPGDKTVCRLCYSTDHQATCDTPPSQQVCKVCTLRGHTSFSCGAYRTTWVPLTPPPSTHAPNPRPLAIIAQQRGLPPPSWSAVASGAPLPPPPSHAPPPSSTDPSAFPALPHRGPAASTPAASASSAHARWTAPPPPPALPAPHASSEITKVDARLGSMETAITVMASAIAQMAASSARVEQLLALFLHKSSGAPLADAPPVPVPFSKEPFNLPTTEVPVFMQCDERKSTESTPAPATSPTLPQAHPGPSISVGSVGNGSVGFNYYNSQPPQQGSHPPHPSAAHPPNYSAATASSLPSHQ